MHFRRSSSTSWSSSHGWMAQLWALCRSTLMPCHLLWCQVVLVAVFWGWLSVVSGDTARVSLFFSYVINGQADASLILNVAVSEFTVGTFTVFLWLAHDEAFVPAGGCGLPTLFESGILVSLPVGVRDALKTTKVVAVLAETGFDISLGYMAYCWSQCINWSRSSSNWLLYNFELSEVYDAQPLNAYSSRRCNDNRDFIVDQTVPARTCFMSQET